MSVSDNSSTPMSPEASLRQAAVLLMAVGKRDAGRVLKYLGSRQVMSLGKRMSKLGPVSVDQLNHALSRCNTELEQLTDVGKDANAYVREMMASSKGNQAAGEKGFDYSETAALDDLKWLDAASVLLVISNEHPQVQAIVLAYLDAEHAAQVLTLMPDHVRQDVIVRIGTLSAIQGHAVEELNAIVAQKIHASAGIQSATMNGSRLVADIFRHLDDQLELDLLKVMQRADQKLHDRVEEQLTGLNYLLKLDDGALDRLLSKVGQSVLVQALQGADQPVYERIGQRLPPHEFDEITALIDGAGPVRLADIDAAQEQLLTLVRP